MKKQNLLILGVPLAAVILECLPWGVVSRFMNPEGEPWITKSSYFDLMPYGYGNIAPLITAVLSCALLAVVLFYVWKGGKKLLQAGRILALIGTILSVCPIFVGAYTAIGVAITVCLAGETLFLYRIPNV